MNWVVESCKGRMFKLASYLYHFLWWSPNYILNNQESKTGQQSICQEIDLMGKWAPLFIPFSLTFLLALKSPYVPHISKLPLLFSYSTTFGKWSFVMVYHNRIEATFYKPFLWAPDCWMTYKVKATATYLGSKAKSQGGGSSTRNWLVVRRQRNKEAH